MQLLLPSMILVLPRYPIAQSNTRTHSYFRPRSVVRVKEARDLTVPLSACRLFKRLPSLQAPLTHKIRIPRWNYNTYYHLFPRADACQSTFKFKKSCLFRNLSIQTKRIIFIYEQLLSDERAFSVTVYRMFWLNWSWLVVHYLIRTVISTLRLT
jgi:hypothetical protein